MDVELIRNKYLSCYKDQKFKIINPLPLVHPRVPHGFIMSVGMAQLDSIFRKKEEYTYTRQTILQHCFRYFDMDKVDDGLHLSSFEMGGSLYLKDYSVEQAALDLYSFLMKPLGAKINNLRFSYFPGGKILDRNLPIDNESYDAWTKLGIKPIEMPLKTTIWVEGENFAQETPLFGIHSELFYFDEKINQPIELGGLLIIPFYQNSQKLMKLPFRVLETGIGVERVALVSQDVDSIYKIDIFSSAYNYLHGLFTEKGKYYQGVNVKNEFNVILDSVRSIYFLVHDHAEPPGSGGRRYIMKRLIRNYLMSCMLLGLDYIEILDGMHANLILKNNDIYKNLENARQKTKEYLMDQNVKFTKILEKSKEILVQNNAKKGQISNEEYKKYERELGTPKKMVDFYLDNLI